MDPQNNSFGNIASSFNPNVPERMEKKQKVKDNSTNGNKKLTFVLIVVVVALLAALSGSVYLLMKEKKKSENPTQVATEEANRIKDRLGKLILLPEGVEPTIATVIDADKLREQNAEFYKNAKNGDKLIVYSDRAILYDMEQNIIINVAPILNPSDQGALPEGEKLTIDLRSGTSDSAKVTSAQDSINGLGDNYSISGTSDAANKNYSGTTVYDLTNGANEALVNALASAFGATVETTLPAGEAISNSNVVVIVGN